MSQPGGPPYLADPEPGSNLKGTAAGAAWTYLLDRLELGTALCIGRPSTAARTTLDRVARSIIELDLRTPTGRADLRGIPPGSVDLVHVTASARSTLVIPGVHGQLAGTLRRNGRLYVEDRLGGAACDELTLMGLAVQSTWWLTPSRGEMRSAVPLDDRPIQRFFVAGGITVPSLPRPLRWLERMRPVAASGGRTGLLARPADTTDATPPRSASIPEYLAEMAAGAGTDLSNYRLGLSARGRYNSRKVIFFLFPPDGDRPTIVVKATRDASHNGRLQNEANVLQRVAALSLVPTGSAPAVAFSREHGGLQFVAESVIDGELMLGRAHETGGTAMYALLTNLATASATRSDAARAAMVSTLEMVEAAVARIYHLSAADRAGLHRATGVIAEHAHRLPSVLMHGDAATWNARLKPDGTAALMDWEAADLQGMPLWDLFYFARSHILWGSRVRALARRPSSMSRALRSNRSLRSAILDYCQRLDIPAELVGPLFTLCWAHRAVREVTRLDSARLAEGHYLGLLRESMDERWADSALHAVDESTL